MWENDTELHGDDFMDNFTIANLSSLFDFDQSNSLTVIGMEGIGKITLAFYYLTTNPKTCNAGNDLTIISSSLVSPGIYHLLYTKLTSAVTEYQTTIM